MRNFPRHHNVTKNIKFPYPKLLKLQLESYRNLFKQDSETNIHVDEQLFILFKKLFQFGSSKYTLNFLDYHIGSPKYSCEECQKYGISYTVPIEATFALKNNETEEAVTQNVFFGDIPIITDDGFFIVNGNKRVIISQIHTVNGVMFLKEKCLKYDTYACRIIFQSGIWFKIHSTINGSLYVSVNNVKKIPLVTLLRAIGFANDKDILELFGSVEEIAVTPKNAAKIKGRRLALDVVSYFSETVKGKIILNRKKIIINKDIIIDDNCIETLIQNNVESVFVHSIESTQTVETCVMANSINIDTTKDEVSALAFIYTLFNDVEAKSEQTTRDFLKNLLFNPKHSLGKIGRLKLNVISDEEREDDFFTVEDLVHVIKHLLKIIAKKIRYDDVDHLGNKCLEQVGDQIYYQFHVSLSKIARTVKERLNTSDFENNNKMRDLFNTNILFNTINSFFAINQLSQYMDEINPLSTIIHKRKIAAIGVGKISKDSLVSEIRDIHYSQYGRVCPIETPEGTSIGLISSLSLFTQINNYKLLITPYRTVTNGIIDLNNENIVYLTAFEEDNKNFVQECVNYDENGVILDDYVTVRCSNDFLFVPKEKVDYCDVSSNQAFSISTALIPFVEHNESTRALMGSNMQKQAVPLLISHAPTVGTGMEKVVIDNFCGVIKAEYDGVIQYVDANKIVVKYDLNEEEKLISYNDEIKGYKVLRMQGSNDSTCINYQPIVKTGQRVTKGEALVNGFASEKGDLAIGNDITVAFVMMNGYNYEDAIVVSERVVRDDLLTSIHIDTYTETIRSTKLGDEEFTKDIQSVNQKELVSLDNDGLVLEGTKVNEGDIIIGKVVPRGVSDSSPEEKLLRSIFGNKTCETKDSSLRLPPFTKGVVVESHMLQRPKKSKAMREHLKTSIAELKNESNDKLKKLRNEAINKFTTLLENKQCEGILTKKGKVLIGMGETFTKENLTKNILCCDKEDRTDLNCFVNLKDIIRINWTSDERLNSLVERLIMKTLIEQNVIVDEYSKQYMSLINGDKLPDGVLKMASVNIANKSKIKVGDKLSGRHGNKGVVSKILKQEDMPFMEDGTPVDIVLTPLGVPSRMNLGQLYESLLGWAGKVLGEKYATPIFSGFSLDDINAKLATAGLPQCGLTQLYDGFTGNKFDQKSTVGVMYILKLNHLVDDKYHARSIGSYSMITQQPLSGRSQFGGQRLGEMEVWALEAFGAAYTVQEMLTVKSDDVIGRSLTYEAIVNGTKFPNPGIPEAFLVLVRELRGLALNVTLR